MKLKWEKRVNLENVILYFWRVYSLQVGDISYKRDFDNFTHKGVNGAKEGIYIYNHCKTTKN